MAGLLVTPNLGRVLEPYASIFAEGYVPGEMMHGPMAPIDQGMPGVAMALGGCDADQPRHLAKSVTVE